MRQRIAAIPILLLLSIFTLSGCNVTSPRTHTNSPQNTNHSIPEVTPKPRTNKAPYLIANSQSIQSGDIIVNTVLGETHCTAFQIKGPNNSSFTNSLNKSIRKNTESAVIQLQKEFTDKLDYIGGSANIVANNLFSIGMNCYNETPYAGLLYNLKTGEQLSLKDVFIDGIDYIKVLNRLMPPIILASGGIDESLMRSPFTTVRPDQSFALTLDKLYIIFAKGEAGFAEHSSIAIPLSQLDPYIDIMDKFLTPDLKASGGVKYNNIFLRYKGHMLQTQPVKISAFDLTVSGLNNPFEQVINKTLQNELDNILTQELAKMKTYKSNPTVDFAPYASIRMYAEFNHYGLLTVKVTVVDNISSSGDGFYTKSITFDLNHQKVIDPADVLLRYLEHNPNSAVTFLEQIQQIVQKDFKENPEFQKEFQQQFNTVLSQHKFSVSFMNYQLQDGTYMGLIIPPNTFQHFDGSLDLAIPLYKILPNSMDTFFND